MQLSDDLTNQVLSLPPDQRYVLAQRLLDSIDDNAAAQFDAEFVAELNRRREEMLRGEEIVSDWRESLDAIQRSLSTEMAG